jgi:hypothetical protein
MATTLLLPEISSHILTFIKPEPTDILSYLLTCSDWYRLISLYSEEDDDNWYNNYVWTLWFQQFLSTITIKTTGTSSLNSHLDYYSNVFEYERVKQQSFWYSVQMIVVPDYNSLKYDKEAQKQLMGKNTMRVMMKRMTMSLKKLRVAQWIDAFKKNQTKDKRYLITHSDVIEMLTKNDMKYAVLIRHIRESS